MVSVKAGATAAAGAGTGAGTGAELGAAPGAGGATAELLAKLTTHVANAQATAKDRKTRVCKQWSMQGTLPRTGFAVARSGHIPPASNTRLPCPP